MKQKIICVLEAMQGFDIGYKKLFDMYNKLIDAHEVFETDVYKELAHLVKLIDEAILGNTFKLDELKTQLKEYTIHDLRTQLKEYTIHDLRNMSGRILRPATVEDYKKWLAGYLKKGGKPTHVYNYDMPVREFYVAQEDFKTVALYGANSFNIIVPKGIKHLGGELGHIELYFMDGFKTTGFVPVYNDIKFDDKELNKKLEEARREDLVSRMQRPETYFFEVRKIIRNLFF